MSITSDSSRIERKYMAHYVDATFGGATPSWYRLGSDFEEFNVELNPEIEIEKNILGDQYVLHNGYAPSADGEPYYAMNGDELFPKLQTIIDELSHDCDTKMLEVHLWDYDMIYGHAAVLQKCYLVPTSYGGDTSGYQIPFNIILYGDKTKGHFRDGVFISDVTPPRT